MDKLRLQLTFKCNNLKVPFNYQHMIQGLIYSAFDKEDKGDFFITKDIDLKRKSLKCLSSAIYSENIK